MLTALPTIYCAPTSVFNPLLTASPAAYFGYAVVGLLTILAARLARHRIQLIGIKDRIGWLLIRSIARLAGMGVTSLKFRF